MKLTSVEIRPQNSTDVAVLSFRDPSAVNPYRIKQIEGLDANEIIPRYYKGSGNSKFYSMSLQNREIVFKVGLNPDFADNETYSDLRDRLYRIISSSRSGFIKICFLNASSIIAAINGFITKLEAPLFEKTQEILLTVKCDDPTLKADVPLSVPLVGLDPAAFIIQDDISTAPHGLTFEMSVSSYIASLIISDPTDDSWNFEVTPITGFLSGDVIHFCSEYNDKYLYIVRDGTTIHLADVISPGSVWPMVYPGENNFSMTDPTVVHWVSLSYYPTYWGV